YNGAGATNPLAGRMAYTRQNAAWPNNNTVTLSMGNAFAGKTVRIRFRIGSDALVHSPNHQGWYIDDIPVSGITNQPFATIVANTPCAASSSSSAASTSSSSVSTSSSSSTSSTSSSSSTASSASSSSGSGAGGAASTSGSGAGGAASTSSSASGTTS